MVKSQLTHVGKSTTQFNSTNNTIFSETINTDLQLFHLGIPLSTIKVNVGFKTPYTVIDISGVFNGILANILTFIGEIEAIYKPAQAESIYVNGLGKSYPARINNFTYVVEPNTNRVSYTMQLFDES